MLTNVHPKLPMRDKKITRDFYVNRLHFEEMGVSDFPAHLMLKKDDIEIHFFEHKTLDPKENYGQIYIRTDNAKNLYESMLENKTGIHSAGHLQAKPWGQIEFSLLDPDNNLLTFGENIP